MTTSRDTANGQALPAIHHEPGVPASEAALRRLLELSCDWYWVLDDQCRLVGLDGRGFNAGPNPMQAQLGRPPWDWLGVLPDGADFAQLRNALLGHVTEASFLGVSTRYAMRTAGGSDLEVFVQNAGRTDQHIGPGLAVRASWDPEFTFVVSKEA